MSEELKPGKYSATIADYSISLSKAGNPMVNVAFDVSGQRITWTGSLKDGKALGITMKNLLTLGLASADNLHELANGKASGLLDTKKQFELDLQMEEYEGNTYLRVKWINDIGFKNTISAAEFKAKLATLNVKGSFALAKENMGVRSAPKKTDQEIIDQLPF